MKIKSDYIANTDARPSIVRLAEVGNVKNNFDPPMTLGKPRVDDNKMAYDECLAMDGRIKNVLAGFRDDMVLSGAPAFLGYALLSNVSQEALIRAGVETIADEMTRKFIKFTYDDDDGKDDHEKELNELETEASKFKLKEKFNLAAQKDGYFGGCLAYIDVGDLSDEELAEPLILDKKTFKAGSFRGLKIIEPINVYPGHYNTNDPTDENYFVPESWYVLGKEYHASRFLYFNSNPAPLLLKPAYNFFGIPRAQMALDYVAHFVENRESAQNLLNKFSLTVWKTDMSQVLQGQSASDLMKRVKLFNKIRNNDGSLVLDKEQEDISQINTPLSGVRDIVDMSLNLLTAVWRIPKIKYIGEGEGGLNASSREQMRSFYDFIMSQKEKMFTEPMEKMLKVLQLNLGKEVNESIGFMFPSMYELDDVERAQLNKQKADRDIAYINAGVLSQEEVRQALSLDTHSDYAMIDVDDVPETMEDVENDEKKQDDMAKDMALDDRWITIGHKDEDENGENGRKGRHILLKDGEEPIDAIERTTGTDIDGNGKVGKTDKEDKGADKPVEKKETEEKPVENKDGAESKTEEKTDKDGEEDLTKLSDEELKKREDEATRIEEKIDGDRYKFIHENEEYQRLEKETDRLRYVYKYETDGKTYKEQEEAYGKYKESEQKQEELYSKLEKEYNDAHPEYMKAVSDRYKYGHEAYLRMEKREEEQRKMVDSFNKRITDLATELSTGKEGVEEKFEKLKQDIKDSSLKEYTKDGLLKTVKDRTQRLRFEKDVDGMKSRVAGYSKNTDKFFDAITKSELPSEKAQKELDGLRSEKETLESKLGGAKDESEKKAIQSEIWSNFSKRMDAFERVKSSRMANAKEICRLLKESFGDTGVKITPPTAYKGNSAGGMLYKTVSELLGGVVGKSYKVDNTPTVVGKSGRAYYMPSNNSIRVGRDSSIGTQVHEFTHYIEGRNEKMLENSRAFLEYRTKGEEAKWLGRGYGYNEHAKEDKFFNAYCGKVYGGSYQNADATELMSMGVERLFEDPKAFAKEDREYFDFVIGNLRGEL